MKLTVTRSSVCAGDDVKAPHLLELVVDDRTTLIEVIWRLIETHYLAGIQGGKATWVAYGPDPSAALAVIAQQWTKPVLLVDDTVTIGLTGGRLYFKYEGQKPPTTVLNELTNGSFGTNDDLESLDRELTRHPLNWPSANDLHQARIREFDRRMALPFHERVKLVVAELAERQLDRFKG